MKKNPLNYQVFKINLSNQNQIYRYEGTFSEGWFHGPGAFWRADGMRYEGEFRGGRVWGKGKFI